MAQQSEYVGFLPKTFLVDKARVIGVEGFGELMHLPTELEKVALTDIGALARHFSQFVLKPTGHMHQVDDLDPSIYKIQEKSGKVNYIVRIKPSNKEKGTKATALIQEDAECPYKGVLRAYLQELNPQSK